MLKKSHYKQTIMFLSSDYVKNFYGPRLPSNYAIDRVHGMCRMNCRGRVVRNNLLAESGGYKVIHLSTYFTRVYSLSANFLHRK